MQDKKETLPTFPTPIASEAAEGLALLLDLCFPNTH